MVTNDMVRDMMAHIARIKGVNSIAQSYIDLIEGMKHEQHEQEQSDQADGHVL